MLVLGAACRSHSEVYLTASSRDHGVVFKVFFIHIKLSVFDGVWQIGRFFVDSVQSTRIFSLQHTLNVAHLAKFQRVLLCSHQGLVIELEVRILHGLCHDLVSLFLTTLPDSLISLIDLFYSIRKAKSCDVVEAGDASLAHWQRIEPICDFLILGAIFGFFLICIRSNLNSTWILVPTLIRGCCLSFCICIGWSLLHSSRVKTHGFPEIYHIISVGDFNLDICRLTIFVFCLIFFLHLIGSWRARSRRRHD